MPVIIAATDFSEIGNNAVNYACSLATDLKASVIIFHSFIVPVTFSDTPMPIIPIDERQKIADERMAELLEQTKQFFPHLDVSAKVIYGELFDDLEEFIDGGISPELIVFGNSGDISIFPGSTVLDALTEMQYPVLAVPHGAIYSPVKKLCFACDFSHINDFGPLQNLLGIVQLLHAELHVLSVDHKWKQADHDTSEKSKQIHAILSQAQPQYHFIDNPDTDAAIKLFLQSNGMDWLVVIPHKHSFFERLFHKSHTVELIHNSKIPLLALHEVGK